MWLSVKKYYQLLKAIAALASRPYLSRIVENADGSTTLEFVQGEKVYQFIIPDNREEYTLQ